MVLILGMLRKIREPFVAEPKTKTCYRCGGEFTSLGGRVCPTCRKPRVRRRTADLRPGLSFRERQIAELVSQAKVNKQIAWELRLTEGTVKEYLNRIFRKLGLQNRTELAIWFIRHQAEDVPKAA